MKTKKRKVSEKKTKKQKLKKLNKNKEFKKVLLTANKTIKKEQGASEDTSVSKDIKKNIVKPIFNAEGKIVFSKFDFASQPGSKPKKKPSSQKVIKNPKQALTSMKEIDKKIIELEVEGNKEKAKEIKTELAWKKAFDKIEGKKVKDDKRLLQKSIKRKQDKKKKSKEQWIERKKKVEQKIHEKQKKRTENINKKLKEKKNTKLKRASKKGRVIPGF